MKKISIVFVAALSLAALGCKKKGGGGDCAAAMDHAMEVGKGDMAKQPGMDDKKMAEMKAMMVNHCTTDKWGDDVLKCYMDAKDSAGLQPCMTKLKKEQSDALMADMMKMMSAGAGG